MKKKSPISVAAAVEQVFADMPDEFHAVFFCARVKVKTGRSALMDGTILRRLREKRTEKPAEFGYACINPETSVYRKLPLRAQTA